LIDSAKLSLGTGSDSQIYYDGTDTFWDLRAAGTGDLMIALAGSFPSPDAGSVHIWNASAGEIDAEANSLLVLENSTHAYINILTPSGSQGAIYFGDESDANNGGIIYAHSTPRFNVVIGGSNSVFWSHGTMALQGEYTISTSTGALNLDAATEVHVNSGGIDRDFKVGNNAIDELLWIDGENARFIGIGGQPGYGTIIDEKLTLGSTGSHFTGFWEHPTVTLSAYHNYTGIDINPAITEDNEYTHTSIYGIHIRPFTITDGGGTEVVTNVAGLRVSAPSEGTTPTNGPYSIWSAAGTNRFDGAISLGTDMGSDGEQLTSGGDDAACDWTAAASLREYKIIGNEADSGQALQAMLDATPYHFRYKEKKGTGDSITEYVGLMADDAPWAMHYHGRIVNPVNTLGYTVLAVQALNDKIERLEALLGERG
jgi:hypothetical protein